MLIRDKLIAQVLDLYIPSLPQESHLLSQPHCLVNPFADDVLEALVMKNDIKYLSQSVIPLMRVEEPPRLQAILKTVTSRVRAAVLSQLGEKTKLESDLRQENYPQVVDQLVKQSDYFVEVINHGNADVRKCCVFCLVEIHTLLGLQDAQST